MTRTNIGKLIEIAMTDKNFTQKDLANKMGVKQQMISQWINGKSNPKTSTLTKLAKALNVSSDYFLGGNNTGVDNLSIDVIERIVLIETEIKKLKTEFYSLRKELKKK